MIGLAASSPESAPRSLFSELVSALFSELVSALRPAASPNGLALVIRCYIDTSGGRDSGLKMAAGFLGLVEQWDALEKEWRAALADAHVSVFHATDFFNFQEEFEGWDRPNLNKHIRFAKRFAAIASKHLACGIGRGVDVVGFNRHAAPWIAGFRGVPNRHFTPLMFAVTQTLKHLGELRRPHGEDAIIAVMEDEPGAGDMMEFFNMEKRLGSTWTNPYISLSLGPKSLPQLQAADYLAHESWRRAKEELNPTGRAVRKSFLRLAQNVPIDVRIVEEKALAAHAEAIKTFMALQV